jgi:hypothetical protein
VVNRRRVAARSASALLDDWRIFVVEMRVLVRVQVEIVVRLWLERIILSARGSIRLLGSLVRCVVGREASEITPSMTLLLRSTVFSRRLKIVGGESRHVSIVVSKRRSADATRPRRRPSKKANDVSSGTELVTTTALALEPCVECNLRQGRRKMEVDPRSLGAADAAPAAHQRPFGKQRGSTERT